MFRTVHMPIIRSFSLYTQQWYMSYKFAGIYLLLCVQWKPPDDGHRNCPRHAEFYSKNKFQNLVNLVGFNTRIFHNTRSPEGQISLSFYSVKHHIIKEHTGMEVWLHVLFTLVLDGDE